MSPLCFLLSNTDISCLSDYITLRGSTQQRTAGPAGASKTNHPACCAAGSPAQPARLGPAPRIPLGLAAGPLLPFKTVDQTLAHGMGGQLRNAVRQTRSVVPRGAGGANGDIKEPYRASRVRYPACLALGTPSPTHTHTHCPRMLKVNMSGPRTRPTEAVSTRLRNEMPTRARRLRHTSYFVSYNKIFRHISYYVASATRFRRGRAAQPPTRAPVATMTRI